MYTAGREHHAEGSARYRGGPRQEGGGSIHEGVPPDKKEDATTGSLATTLWGWAKGLASFVRLDVLLAVTLGSVLVPWLARLLLGSLVGRLVLPRIFGKGSYEANKGAYHAWLSATIDRLIPPPGVDETRAGEGIIDLVGGGGGTTKGAGAQGSGSSKGGWLWWVAKPQMGAFLIRALRWTVKAVLGV